MIHALRSSYASPVLPPGVRPQHGNTSFWVLSPGEYGAHAGKAPASVAFGSHGYSGGPVQPEPPLIQHGVAALAESLKNLAQQFTGQPQRGRSVGKASPFLSTVPHSSYQPARAPMRQTPTWVFNVVA
jgi:hypothetical protein